MKITFESTMYSGKESLFPLVDSRLRMCFPNSAYMLDRIAMDRTGHLTEELRWLRHVLQQLTFSYLSLEYLTTTVTPALENFPDTRHVPAIKELRDVVARLVSGRFPFTAEAIGDLNRLAVALFDQVREKRSELLHDAMDSLGRRIFGEASHANANHVRRSFSLLGLAVTGHMSEFALAMRFREQLSFPVTEDCEALKKDTIAALTVLQSDLKRSEAMLCAFVSPEIKMHTSVAHVGPARMYRSGEPELRQLLAHSKMATDWLADFSSRRPFEAIVLIDTAAYPTDYATGFHNAALTLETIFGFLTTQVGGNISAPARYDGIMVLANSTAQPFVGASARPQKSPVIMTDDKAVELGQTFTRFVEPIFSETVEHIVQGRFRRTLQSLRRGAFLAACSEFSQAYANAWQAYEVMFGGVESRDRGVAIARRVAAISVAPDGTRSDQNVILTDDDLLRFARDVEKGIAVSRASTPDAQTALKKLATMMPGDPALAFWRMLLGFEIRKDLLEWKELELKALSATPNPERIRATQDEVYQRFLELYKVRNDIVHAGYADDEIAKPLYGELFTMMSSIMLTLAYNLAHWRTYAEFLGVLDAQWYRLRTSDETLRAAAYERWEKRGRPNGDDWSDWFATRERFGLQS